MTGRVAGNVTVIGGNTVADAQARVDGRTAVVGGNAVYETDDALSGNAYVVGGHISSFAGRPSPRRRVSLSPIRSAILFALFLIALLTVTRLGRRPAGLNHTARPEPYRHA